VSGSVLVAAWIVLPASAQRTQHRLDAVGAALLGAALGGLLLVLSEAEAWGWASVRVVGIGAAGLALAAVWGWHELRTTHPLVDLRLARNRAVLTAHATGAFATVGMYLLMSLVIRYVQTPKSAGYGLGETVVVAGLVLLPLSATSIAASRLAPLIARRTSAVGVLPIGCLIFVVATLLFVFGRGSLWQVMLVMAVAGLGVGCSFAAIPGLIVRAVPTHETGSALSFNQVLRYIGGSIGSALCGSVLAAHTARGHLLPAEQGYNVTALIGCSALVLAAGLSFLLGRSVGDDDEVLAGESVADALEVEDMAVD
jgi:predicted MFS family arabinose efflux permease